MKCLIFDFETLSQKAESAAIISMASMVFDLEVAEKGGYSYDELLSSCSYLKFDVEEQVTRFNRKIDPNTVDWWKEQSKEAFKKLKPSSKDVSIVEMPKFLDELMISNDIKYVFTRNNTFDPVIVQTICHGTNRNIPYPWWSIRDIKSFIMGLTYGVDIRDDFMPDDIKDKFVKHDPCHDISADVYRIQTIFKAKFDD
jgi:hypothetical protein